MMQDLVVMNSIFVMIKNAPNVSPMMSLIVILDLPFVWKTCALNVIQRRIQQVVMVICPSALLAPVLNVIQLQV